MSKKFRITLDILDKDETMDQVSSKEHVKDIKDIIITTCGESDFEVIKLEVNEML